MKAIPSFAEFYVAVNGWSPFPWQERLALTVASTGWPTEIGVPTGLGKTGCLDIAVWALAAQADRPPAERSAPTRIWWLVNRRLLVDSTADHATRLMKILADPASSDAGVVGQQVLTDVADRLRSLSPEGRTPIEVVRLRGGVASARPSTPAQPAIVLSTLPMYGSRLLFRGFGASSSMWPIDAALAGTDSLVLIDEAHLARNLVDLFDPLAACDRHEVDVLGGGRSRPQVVTLTATGDAHGTTRFDLDAADLAHPVVQQRLAASKPTRIVEAPDGSKIADVLVDEAIALIDLDRPTATVVFANTPKVARDVFASLRKHFAADEHLDLELLTGRMRDRESLEVRARVLHPESGAPSSRPRVARSKSLVVVATQTLEVGADLDFEQMVTEACGVRALTQRLGRVNRLGQHSACRVVYVHATPKANKVGEVQWPVYGTEPRVVLERLRAAESAGMLELGPGAVRDVLGPALDAADYAPQVMPALLWEWAKTTLAPEGEAPVELYFEGLQDTDLSVSVCWRSQRTQAGGYIWPRPRDAETVEVPIYELRAALGERSAARLQRDRLTVEVVSVDELRPGDLVVMHADDGYYDSHGWAPDDGSGTVLDVAVLERGLPLDADALATLVGPGPWGQLLQPLLEYDDDVEPAELSAAARRLIAELRSRSPKGCADEEWSAFLDGLSPMPRFVTNEVARLELAHVPEEPRADELDELSLARVIQLDRHGEGVGLYARRIAERIGLSASVGATVELAGEFHDLGKADGRFQAWLDPLGRADTLIAKSDRPRSRWQSDQLASGWPRGGRHEALSARLVIEWLAENAATHAELLVHLVASHHGQGRPLIAPAEAHTTSTVQGSVRGRRIDVSDDLGVSDWSQPRRFRALCSEYGFWGLVLLEACVRQADHVVSSGDVDWSML